MEYDDLMKRCQAVAAANGPVFKPPVFDTPGGPEYTRAEPGRYITRIVFPQEREIWGGTGATAEAAMADLLSRHE